jgi:hypothetical protein
MKTAAFIQLTDDPDCNRMGWELGLEKLRFERLVS